MNDISKAITAKKAEIKRLQADLEALARAASIIRGSATTGKKKAAKAKRRKMSAAARKAVSKRMKAMWAAKRKGKK